LKESSNELRGEIDMRRRTLMVIAVAVLLVAGGWLLWRTGGVWETNVPDQVATGQSAARSGRAPASREASRFESTAPVLPATVARTNESPLSYRLSNTTKTSSQLLRDDRAILLENALIDVSRPVNFQVPESLQPAEEPGAYLIQARGAIGSAFRAAVQAAGAEYVSFIPNNAWLIRASAAAAQQLRANGAVQAVLPWQPVYKLKSDLLVMAMQGKTLPDATALNLLVTAADQAAVRAQIEQMQGRVVAEDRSPFGAVITVRLQPGADWAALARTAEVLLLEQAFARGVANDLTRVQVGVATMPTVQTNYLGLSGTNITVGINDLGVDATHPDLAGRIFALNGTDLTDTNGHGTHVAGIIGGSGLMSTDVVNARGSSNPGTDGQFRGMAPGAKLFAQRFSVADGTLQENTARTNIFISNNSWSYLGDSSYSLAAASYDAAVRDSLPGLTGSQPVLYVFSVGNGGGGSDGGGSGTPGTVQSPATAKNVVSVGAIELPRDITNIVTKISMVGTNQTTNTSTPWKAMTSSANQVAAFSARGNVGIGVEGDYGRVKPDVMAPGTFVISTRSSQWDERAYYNPTSHHFLVLSDEIIGTNGLTQFSIFLPDNAVGFNIRLESNSDSPTPFPNLPIYVRRDAVPTTVTFDVRRTNSVSVPPDLPGVGSDVGQTWAYAIGNPTGAELSLDIVSEIITTNDLGDYFQVLSNLNNSISASNAPTHYYRYESGTSMAAASVSGTLALMQEFFEQRMSVTVSPALMKALLVNGARSVGDLYDYQVQNSINYQGWGLVKLNNNLSLGISNAFNYASGSVGDIKLFDQSPTNALATGQFQTRTITLDPEAGFLSLQVTLAWTDPPGNPAAGIKLVNDLDLVVTNLDTGEIYLGNDFPGSSIYTAPWDTNGPPNADSVNNVENVILSPMLGTNYSITVLARRINVNAVTAHTNDVVQDYALVISCGSGELANAFAITNQTGIIGNGAAQVTHPAATINQPDDFQAFFLEDQRVGANTPLLGTTNGMTNQWHFYVVTNNTTFTNAAFLISQHTDLAVPRMGVRSDEDDATRRYADLDLYVSTDSDLTNLVPAVVNAAFKSTSRNELSGDELLQFTNAQPIYYIGVKSEDQMAGEYDFFAIFSLLPLGAEDANGFVRAYPMTGYVIPDGSPSLPGGTRFLAVTAPSVSGGSESVRRVVITNNVSHENYGDIIASISHNSRAVVFDNHRSLASPPYPLPPGPYDFLYDDSGEGDFVNSIPTDGPGSLNTYMGEIPAGTWYFSYSDDALSQVGQVNDLRLRVDRQCESNCSLTNTVAPNSWRYFSRNVPVEATNLTVCIDIITPSNPQPLELYIRKGARPTQTVYDYRQTINPPGDCLTIDKFQLPPLSPGRYFIGVFNPNATEQTFVYTATVLLGPPPTPFTFNPGGSTPLLDDAVTNHSIFVTDSETIARVDVGLRIDHPRVSDLAVTLISPSGTRVLLVENRGGTSTGGFGSSLVTTNFVPVDANGGQVGQTNFIPVGAIQGTITIDYDFQNEPDQMTVYYEGTLLHDTGMIGGTGQLNLNYGPGGSTDIEIRMNEFTNASVSTLWSYTVSSYNRANTYLTFTENTNLTTTPVKYALPPFVGTGSSSYGLSDFEPPTVAQDYAGPTVNTPDGWSVVNSNTVTVMTNPVANTGVQSLALRSGTISRTIATTPTRTYQVGYAYRKVPNLNGIIAWYPSDGNSVDIIAGNNGALANGATYTTGMVNGAFFLDGTNDRITAAATPALNFGPGADFTFEGWIQAFPTPGNSFGVTTILDKRFSPTTTECVGIGLNLQDGRLAIQMSDGPVANAAWQYYVSAAPNLQDGQWHHIAASVQRGTTAGGQLYVDGVSVLTFNPTLEAGDLTTTAPLRIGNHDLASLNCFFRGMIDEMTIYGRALGGAEIQAIYAAGAAGKCGLPIPPGVCPSPGAQIYVPGQVTNTFVGSTNWQQGALVFTATGNTTTLNLSPVSTNQQSGVLVDTFTVTELAMPLYVLPEESLKAFEGENSYGLWQLEILDTRSGASNNVALVDWQLQFVYQTNTAAPRVLTPGVPVDVTLPPGQIVHFIVDVPSFARFATNVLFNASSNVGFYFNQARPPLWGATNVGDVVFAAAATDWTETLSLTTTPPLVPGQRYYLAVENPNPPNIVPVTFTVYVDFDLRALPPVVDLTNGVPYCTVNPTPFSSDYYRFTVSTNAVRAQFEIDNPSGDMTLFLRRDLPPSFVSFDYLSATPSTNDEVITVFDFTQPIPLTPGDWYFAAANLAPGPVSYCAGAWEWFSYGTNIVITNVFLGTNSFCLTWTSLPGVRYVVEGVTNLNSTNWVAVSPTITGAGPSTTYCVPLPSPYQFFRVREGQTLTTFVPQPVIIRILKRFNGIEITWSGPPGQQYNVEWSPTLVPATWTAFAETITSTTGIYGYTDDGSQTGGFGATRYYRLVLLP
jgi:subtilisin family serine protease/subtilisin-like proprotein convertase family protein